jgi:Family of unknown function (DUF6163)
MKKPVVAKRLLEAAPLPAITLTGAGSSGPTRWALALVWFCRLCAALWLIAGLLQWSFILGFIAPPGLSFETAGVATRIATGFYAVIDIIAAVGLWLTAPWGATVWFLSAAAQIGFPFALHDYGGANAVTIAINTCLLAVFILIKFMIRRHERSN